MVTVAAFVVNPILTADTVACERPDRWYSAPTENTTNTAMNTLRVTAYLECCTGM
jgi:hypothetical protein